MTAGVFCAEWCCARAVTDDEALSPLPPPGEDDPEGADDWDALLDQVRQEQFDSPAAAYTAAVLGAVMRHPRAVESLEGRDVKLAVLQTLADSGDIKGMTLNEVCQQLSGRWAESSVRVAVLGLVQAGTVARTKVGRPRLLPTMSMAAALELSPELADIHGHRRLLEMFDRLRTEAESGAADKELLAMLVRLRRQVSIYTFHARSACRDGDRESILAHTEVDETEFKRRFKQASESVADRPMLVDGLAALNTAVYDYLDAQGDLVARLMAGRVRLADARLLSPEEYRRAAKYATPEQLASVFDGVLFDQPPVWLDPAAIESAVDDIVGTRPPERIPEPGGHGDRRDHTTLLDIWRLTADQLLAGQPAVDLLDELMRQPWPGPAVTTTELVALAIADRRYRLDRSDAVVVVHRDDPRRATAVTPSVLTFTPTEHSSARVLDHTEWEGGVAP